jgi:hypothetical protein
LFAAKYVNKLYVESPSAVGFNVVGGNNIILTFLDFLGARRFLFAAVIAIGFRTKYVFMVLVLDVLIVYH